MSRLTVTLSEARYKALKEAAGQGWTVVSVHDDWSTVF